MSSDIGFFSAHVRYILAFIGIKGVTLIDGSGIGRDGKNTLARANETIMVI